jgi:hypothetical protein
MKSVPALPGHLLSNFNAIPSKERGSNASLTNVCREITFALNFKAFYNFLEKIFFLLNIVG